MQCAVDKGNCSIQQTGLVFDTSIVHCESLSHVLHVVQVQLIRVDYHLQLHTRALTPEQDAALITAACCGGKMSHRLIS